MHAVLAVRCGAEAEQRLTLTEERITFGRAQDNHLACSGDARLSRQHFAIEYRDGRWVALDLKSRNGTFVNGQRIKEHVLVPGDRITAGSIVAEFQDAAGDGTETMTTLDTALRTAILPSDPESAERHMQALVRVGRELAQPRPLSEFWQWIIDAAVEALQAERGAIALLDCGELQVVARHGHLDISHAVSRRVIEDRVSLRVRDVGVDADLADAPSLAAYRVQTLMAAPLQTAAGVLGMIYVDRVRLPEFTSQELDLLTILANIAALRLEHACVLEEAERERERTREMERKAAAQRRALEAAEMLRYAETRAVLAETASSMTRLAAAISHDLNTPLGALTSSVETLLAAAARGRQGSDPSRFLALTEDLSHSIKISAERLSETIRRLQRFTNLDRAEVQEFDLAEFFRDIAAANQSAGGPIQITPDMHYRVVSRPQQLATVFSALLERVCGAANFTGRLTERGIEVRLHAPDLTIAEAELSDLFDPAFRVRQGRVGTENWSLFTARQIVRELGGDVQAESDAATGTVFTVLIPSEAPPI